MFKRKAISPVVAVSLLLVVSLISVVGFQGWFNNFSSTVFVDVETKNSKINSLKVEYIDRNSLYVNSNIEDYFINLNFFEIGNNNEVCAYKSGFNNSGLFLDMNFDSKNNTHFFDISGENNSALISNNLQSNYKNQIG